MKESVLAREKERAKGEGTNVDASHDRREVVVCLERRLVSFPNDGERRVETSEACERRR